MKHSKQSKSKAQGHIKFDPKTGFSGITPADRMQWLQKYPQIDNFDWTIREGAAWLLQYPAKAERAGRKPREFLDWWLGLQWEIIYPKSESEPDLPELKSLSELAEKIKGCRTFAPTLHPAGQSKINMKQAEEDYVVFYRLAFELGATELPGKTDNPYFDLTELQRCCEGRKRGKINTESKAIMLFREHPDWHKTEIAEKLGITRGRLYQMPLFMKATKYTKGDKSNIPRGNKDSETGKIEAWEPDE